MLAKDGLDAGNVGLGFLVSATGVGLVIGSFFAASALAAFGMTRVYGGALSLMAAGFGLAAASPTIVVAALLAAIATIREQHRDRLQPGARPARLTGCDAGAGALRPDVGLLRGARALDGGRRVARRLLGRSGRMGVRRMRLPGRRSDGVRAHRRIPEAAGSRAGEGPAGLARIRSLMDEIEETRRREQQRAKADLAVLAPQDTEGRPAP